MTNGSSNSPASLPPITFVGSLLDRADPVRNDPAALAALMNARARLILLDDLDPRFDANGAIVWGSLADAPDDAELVFLGLDEAGHGCFAAVSPPGPGSRSALMRLLPVLGALPPADAAAYGIARGLVSWHQRHRFCAACGAPTRIARGGWQRSCENCGTEHFPRTDPVAIMLVEHDDAVLLGRQRFFPPGQFSALAGFIEPGESIEEGAAREVYEEAGVRVRDVRYVASQPWPFPSSLMIGCHAMADSRDLVVDGHELEDARWFTRAEVADAVEASRHGHGGKALRAPPPFAIAWHLMARWLAAG